MSDHPPGCSAPSGEEQVDSIYSSLPAGDFIRRIILEPHEEEDAPLVGRLEVIKLSDACGDDDSFEAMSYVWGSDVKDQTITINGIPLQITTNLSRGLRETRLPDRPRALWADGICINQDDNEEKGHQVGLMGQIYKTSRCTLICFEYTTEPWPHVVASLMNDVEAAMDLILSGDDPKARIEADGDRLVYPWPELKDHPLFSDERWHSWVKLELQPWFERGWVMQEALLGPECLVFWAGVKLSWKSICRVERWLNSCRHDIEPLNEWGRGKFPPTYYCCADDMERPREYMALLSRASINTAPPGFESPLNFLVEARKLKLKDPRDRIYAFMGLPTKKGFPPLHVSYGEDISHLDVYRHFAIQFVETHSDLEILRNVEHEDEDIIIPSGFPSWVPRWDRGHKPYGPQSIWYGPQGSIELDDCKEVVILDKSILRVQGIIFDSVEFVSSVIQKPEQSDPEAQLAPVISLWRDIAQHSIYPNGPRQNPRSSAEAFLSGLCLGGGGFRGKRRRGFLIILEALAKMLEADWSQQNPPMDIHDICMQTNEEDDTDLAHHLAAGGLRTSNGCRFLVLGRGEYAVSSVATRVGDVCALISGTHMPFILREVAGKQDHYALVGVAYVQSRALTDDGLPDMLLGEHETAESWGEFNLPSAGRDIFLC